MNTIKATILAALATIGLSSASALTLSVGGAHYLGAIVDGNPPGSNEINWVNQLGNLTNSNPTPTTNPTGETLYRLSATFTNLPDASSFVKTDNPAQGTYLVGANSLYLLGKYGTFTLPTSGTGQVSHVWYIGDILVGTELRLPGFSGTSPTTNDPLSHDTIFNGTRPTIVTPPSVPEGGVSLMLLGSALLGLAAVRRFFRR